MDIAKLKELAMQAAPGPWDVDPLYGFIMDINAEPIDFFNADYPSPNADFIAAANPATVLELIAENAELRAKLAAMESQEPIAWMHDIRNSDVISETIRKLVKDSHDKYGIEGIGAVQRPSVDKTEHYTIPLYAKPVPADKPLFQAACSGMWYQNPMACGEVSAVKIGDCGYKLPSPSQQSDGGDCAVAAIEYAIDTDEGIDFLRYWFYGEFDVLRRNWDNIPDRVFIGADPLFNSDRCPSHESEGE